MAVPTHAGSAARQMATSNCVSSATWKVAAGNCAGFAAWKVVASDCLASAAPRADPATWPMVTVVRPVSSTGPHHVASAAPACAAVMPSSRENCTTAARSRIPGMCKSESV
ncbi:unnamed protein product [Lampetra planeri]